MTKIYQNDVINVSKSLLKHIYKKKLQDPSPGDTDTCTALQSWALSVFLKFFQ